MVVNSTLSSQDWQRAASGSWTLAQLNARVAPDTTSGGGARIEFVEQAQRLSALDYERQIFTTGRVPTRVGEAHDYFNAMMWLAFPRMKAGLNRLHVEEGGDGAGRSRRRDLATLLDEVGVVIVTRDQQFEALNREHCWHELFVVRRQAWHCEVQPYIVGHGLCEQLLRPYVGLTAKALYLSGLEPGAALCEVDAAVAAWLSTAQSPQALSPFPVLGVPGWWPENECPDFYRQENYFRPKARSRKPAM